MRPWYVLVLLVACGPSERLAPSENVCASIDFGYEVEILEGHIDRDACPFACGILPRLDCLESDVQDCYAALNQAHDCESYRSAYEAACADICF